MLVLLSIVLCFLCWCFCSLTGTCSLWSKIFILQPCCLWFCKVNPAASTCQEILKVASLAVHMEMKEIREPCCLSTIHVEWICQKCLWPPTIICHSFIPVFPQTSLILLAREKFLFTHCSYLSMMKTHDWNNRWIMHSFLVLDKIFNRFYDSVMPHTESLWKQH